MKQIVERVLRTALAIVFLLYAFAKFSGMQFFHFELNDPVSDMSPVTLVWYFFGYSKSYAMFIACGELTAGLLLLFRRTYLVGLPLYFGIALNVAVLDWSFGLPVPATMLATTLAAVSLYLMVSERAAYLPLLAAAKSKS